MIHGVGVGGTRRLKIGPVTSPTSPEALAPTPQKEHRPQSEPSHLLSLSWEHREVAPITPCSSRDRAGLCSPATLSGMWPDGPRCACHTRGPASVCTRRLQTGHHSSFQSQCPHDLIPPAPAGPGRRRHQRRALRLPRGGHWSRPFPAPIGRPASLALTYWPARRLALAAPGDWPTGKSIPARSRHRPASSVGREETLGPGLHLFSSHSAVSVFRRGPPPRSSCVIKKRFILFAVAFC